MRIAIIDKVPSRTNYGTYFDFDFDLFHLCSDASKNKILKKDIDIQIEEDDYDFIITVGADATKQIAKKGSVINHQGYLIDDKYIPITSPNMLSIKPQVAPAFYKAIENIVKYISGDIISEDTFDLKGIQDEEEAIAYIRSLLDDPTIENIAVDTETSSLYPRDGHILGICLSHKKEFGRYIDADYINEECESLLQLLFEIKNIIFHNSKFDIKWLEYHFGFTFDDFEDTMLEHYVLDETKGTHDLKSLAIKYTGLGAYDLELEEYKAAYCKQHGVLKRDFTYDLIPFEIMYKYASLDPAATIELHEKFNGIISKNKFLSNVYNNILKEGSTFLRKVEENGIPVSTDRLHSANEKFVEIERNLTEELYKIPELKGWEEDRGKVFNFASPVQIRDFLFNWCGIAPSGVLTDKGEDSTNEEALTKLAKYHPIANTILQLRKTVKLRNTYIAKILQGLDSDGRLRTNFNLTTTTSGRLSSSGKLNAQTMPRKSKTVKGVFCARPGYKVVSLDLKTAEMYVASVLSGDKNLQEVFITGVDYHGFMAVNKFDLPCDPNEVGELYPNKRQEAKTISFEILYKLNYSEPVLANFPELKKWLQAQESHIKANASIYSAFGRKRRLPNVKSSSREIVQHEVRSGINFLVQSVASDINLLAGIEMQKFLDKGTIDAKIFMLVHDSIVAEVKDEQVDEYIEILTEIIQKDRGCSIPGTSIGVDIEIGQDYSFSNEYETE